MRLAPFMIATLVLAASPRPSSGAEPPGREEPDGTTQWARPADVPPSLPAGAVGARAERPSPSTRGGAYSGLRALSTGEGEARLSVEGGEERTVRPGDRLGADVVEAVDQDLLVLSRPALPGQPGGESTVVIRFDGQGRPSVRVYYVADPTPSARPEPK